ncbi:MAG: translation initiation factor IF-1, partial [Sweet potato little leaf phytoplasma]|nr:translation initiation factor IF-1 [Sweet potato little leaf phytoplasma]
MSKNSETHPRCTIDFLDHAKFKLELPNKKNIIACISGKIRKNNIHISLGDK